MSDATIRILITGMSPRTVELNEGETLADLRDRLSSSELPLHKIETLYLNGKPVSNPSAHELSAGDVVGGAPKLEGGSL